MALRPKTGLPPQSETGVTLDAAWIEERLAKNETAKIENGEWVGDASWPIYLGFPYASIDDRTHQVKVGEASEILEADTAGTNYIEVEQLPFRLRKIATSPAHHCNVYVRDDVHG